MKKHSLSENTNIIQLKQKLKTARKKKGYSQEELCDQLCISNRSTLSHYENTKGTKIPDLYTFVELCDVLDTDPNYLLGYSQEENITAHTFSEELNISETSVKSMMHHSTAAAFADAILSTDSGALMEEEIKWLQVYQKLSGVVTTAFTSRFLTKLKTFFDAYYTSTFPFEYSEEGFTSFLLKHGIFRGYTNPEEFLEKCLLTDAKNNLYASYPDFDDLENKEKYQCILSTIVLHAYDYFMCEPHITMVKKRLLDQLQDMIDEIVDRHI
ncbi:MAG: helix-turn-helix domain-containing protein [Lachnospiraceae bacterium]